MEPQFLDDETLTDNIDDEKAVILRDWLGYVNENRSESINLALSIVKRINRGCYYEYEKEFIYWFITQFMSLLEEKNEKKI